MKRKVDNKTTVSTKRVNGKVGRGAKKVTFESEGNFKRKTFKVINKSPTKLTIKNEQSKKGCEKRGQIRKNTKTVSSQIPEKKGRKSQSKSKKTVRAEKSQPFKASHAKMLHKIQKGAQNQTNRKTLLKKVRKRKVKKQKAPKARKDSKIMRARMMAVLRQAKFIKIMNEKAIERAKVPFWKNSRYFVYKAINYLSLYKVRKSVLHKFSRFSRNKISYMTTLDLTPYHDVFKEGLFRVISSSSLSLLCQVMNNAIHNMDRSCRIKLMIKDFVKGGLDLQQGTLFPNFPHSH